MKVTLESTSKVVELNVNGTMVPARIWEGETAAGVKCHAFITRISVGKELNAGEFERDLTEHKPLSPELEKVYFPDGIPLRLIL